MGFGEVGERGDLFTGPAQHVGHDREFWFEHRRDDLDLGPDQRPGGLGEDGADRRGDHLGVALGDLGQHLSHEMNSTPLPRRADHGGPDRVHQTPVVIGDHHRHPVQSPLAQAAQELGPEVLGFGVPDRPADVNRAIDQFHIERSPAPHVDAAWAETFIPTPRKVAS
jgi:hypothetical protein